MFQPGHNFFTLELKDKMLRTESKEPDIKTEEAYDEFQIGGKYRIFLLSMLHTW